MDPLTSAPPPAAAPSAPVRPRLWPTVLVLLASVPVIVLVAGVAAVVAAFFDGVDFTSADAGEQLEGWAEGADLSTRSFLLVLVPIELTLLGLALLAALPSKQRLLDRLSLRRPRASGRLLALVALGTLGLQLAITSVADLLVEQPSPALEQLSRLVLGAEGAAAVALIALLSILPGLCEEMFCRGYLQTRFVAAGGARGLIVPTLFFALIHFDPMHVLFVLPLGAWFGFVAWRTQSTWTAVLVHTFNNATAFGIARFLQDAELESASSTVCVAGAAVLLPFTLIAARALLRERPAEG